MTRRVAFCADDYGYNRDVDHAIVELIGQGRLNGASCMVDAPRFAEAAAALRQCDVEIGLHVNLSESFIAAPRVASLHALLARSWLRLLDKAQITARIHDQLDRFEAEFGRAPDYVDGHQHTHQFAQVRDLLLKELSARYGARRPLIRSTDSDRPDAKARALTRLGGRALHELLRRERWPTNADFVGAYAFSDGVDFTALAQQWLATLKDGAMWMCHPALRAQLEDPIGPFRVAEYRCLRSDLFAPGNLPADLRLVRPSQLAVAG